MARPQKYERDKVIGAAQTLFWEKGYQATSIIDLQSATALKPGSLYKAFGNKDGLLKAVLNNYTDTTLLYIDSLVEEQMSVKTLLEVFFKRQVDRACDKNTKGCLLVNSLLEFHGQHLHLETEVKKQLQRVQKRFETLVEQGVMSGEFDKEVDASEKATAIMTVVWGLGVMSRMNPEEAHLQAFCDTYLSSFSQ